MIGINLTIDASNMSLFRFQLITETLLYFLTYLGQSYKASTIKRKNGSHFAAIRNDVYNSLVKTVLVRDVWEGLQRSVGVKEQGKEALWLQELRQLVSGISGDRLINYRNRAMLVIGCAAALRRNEFVQLGVKHVALPYGSNPKTCPVRLLEDWSAVSGITMGSIFRRMDQYGNILE